MVQFIYEINSDHALGPIHAESIIRRYGTNDCSDYGVSQRDISNERFLSDRCLGVVIVGLKLIGPCDRDRRGDRAKSAGRIGGPD